MSYSCMPNIAARFSGHKQRLEREETCQKKCNCRVKAQCPMDGHCQTSGIVYEARVNTEQDEAKQYIGLAETSFKVRYANHKTSFHNEKYRNSTELSKHLWNLRDTHKMYLITWSIKERARPCNCATKRCNLCLAVKNSIITANKNETLNKRCELVSKCRHANKYKLSNLTGVT